MIDPIMVPSPMFETVNRLLAVSIVEDLISVEFVANLMVSKANPR